MVMYFSGFDSSLSLDVVSVKLGPAYQTQKVMFRMNIYVDIVIQFLVFFFFSIPKNKKRFIYLRSLLRFIGTVFPPGIK